MKNVKDYEEAREFSIFVNKMRQERNLSMEQLCEGLCTARLACYLESGEKVPDKLVQDRILERLGVGAEDYEHFVGYPEYDRWEARTRILHCISHEKMERAELLLAEYQEKFDMKKPLEKQFYLAMQAQVLRYQGQTAETLGRIFEEAARLTVPGMDEKPLKELALSFRELNLILEYEQYRQGGKRWEKYLEILKYIELVAPDRRSRAKIYPKVVVYLYRCALREKRIGMENIGANQACFNMLYGYVNESLEILRENVRLYFMWEILDIRERLLGSLQAQCESRGESEAEDVVELLQENKGWREALEDVYEEFHVPKETFEYCYLYVVKGVSCINDVICIRRKMLGLTQQELCGEFWNVRTLQRIEGRQVSPQVANVRELFRRLGMPTELVRTELVTADVRVRELMDKLRIQVNEYNRKEADELLQQIKQMISMDEIANQQVIMNEEALSEWDKGVITNDEYCERMKKALELTLPYEAFMRPGEKYLTHSEQTCVQNMMLGMDVDSEEYKICLQRLEEMYQAYPENELQEGVSSMYEFLMLFVGSKLGNRGEYDRADKYNQIIVPECLRLHRLASIPSGLYDRLWNHKQRKLQGIPVLRELDAKAELTRCIRLSELGRKGRKKRFYEKKLAEEIV